MQAKLNKKITCKPLSIEVAFFMANIILKPSWAKYEKGIHDNDTETQIRETDAFLDERDKETQNSRKAREWEKGRKKEWARLKPQWKKQKILQEQEPFLTTLRKLREGGYLMENLRPVPGFIIIKPDETNERITASGVILPGSVAEETCTADVIRIGGDKKSMFGTEPCPCKDNDRILYRHDTGLKITIKGVKMLMIGHADVLGILED